MRYIKYFEMKKLLPLKKIVYDNKYFKTVSADELYDSVFSNHDYSYENEFEGDEEDFVDDGVDKYENWVNFTDGEKKRIDDIIGQTDSLKAGPGSEKYHLYSSPEVVGIRYAITKLKDGWYYVEKYGNLVEYYRCDQFDALLKCLKQLNKFNPNPQDHS